MLHFFMIHCILKFAKKLLLILSFFCIIACSPPASQKEVSLPIRFQEVKALAEIGNPSAQYHLGNIYRKEIVVGYWDTSTVVEDKDQAARWYRKAADQGYAAAQNKLAWCYSLGLGVQKDYIQAYKWLLLSEWGGEKKDSYVRKWLEEKATDSQKGKANELATEFIPILSKK